MGMRMVEVCAFCGKPLRLFAGFCIECQAPATVAQRPKLVADARRRAGIALVAQHRLPQVPTAPLTTSVRTGVSQRVPRWTRWLTILGGVSLLLAGFFIFIHIEGFAAEAAWSSPSTMSVRIDPGHGANVSHITTGQPFFLTYTMLVQQDWVDVTLTVAPEHAPAHHIIDRWTRGQAQQAFPMTALMPGKWIFTLQANGQMLQQSVLQVTSASLR